MPDHAARYARDNPGWHAADAAHKAAAVDAVLRALRWTPATVVDVGCGTGDVLGHLQRLRPAPFAGWGVDPSAPWAGDPPHLRRGGAKDAAPADLALCLDVAEHVPDPVDLLASLRPLAPRAVLRLPLDLSVWDLLRPERALAARARYGHLHAWTAPLARAVVAEAGWAVVHARYDRVPPDLHTLRQRVADAVRHVGLRVAPAPTVTWLGGFSLLLAAEHARPGSPPSRQGLPSSAQGR